MSDRYFFVLNLFMSGVKNLTVHALSVLVFRLMEELEEVHSLNLNERLAKFILMRTAGSGRLNMTQCELAAHLGTTREVVAKLLRKMVEEKLVRTMRGAIVVEQPVLLARRAKHAT